jgi:uncharacterized membrane protein YbhN (UPF0104 family)
VTDVSRQLDELLSDRRALGSSALWAAGNWIFDAASLWAFLAAYGHRINPVTLLVAYGIANLLGRLRDAERHRRVGGGLVAAV